MTEQGWCDGCDTEQDDCYYDDTANAFLCAACRAARAARTMSGDHGNDYALGIRS